MKLLEALDCIRPINQRAQTQTQKRLDSIIKPLGSLGILERQLVKISGMTGSHQFDFHRKAVVVFCADNGVVAQGISQSGQEVTAIVTENLATGDTCLCAMARVAGADVIPVDVGVAVDLEMIPGLLCRKVSYGTADFTVKPAMSSAEAEKALEVGIDMARELAGQGYSLLATGEMGIGNTTTSAAVAAVLLGLSPRDATGRGAGLSKDGLERKIHIIEQAIALHRPDPSDPVEVLAKIGGLDIAGMAGLCIGGAVCGVPVVLDGFISTVAALVACHICPQVVDFLLPSHLSPEPACALIMEQLGLIPLLHAEMRLGEGTGAVATFPLYDMISAVYSEMVTFEDEAMEAYQPL